MTYDEFLKTTKKINTIEYISNLLSWDEEIMLTKGGQDVRSQQTSLLATIAHEELVSEKFAKLLEIEGEDDVQKANLREMTRYATRARKVPSELVEKLSVAQSKAFHIWREAREKKDFSLFAPILKEIIALKQEYARAINPDKDLYETLVEDYEPYISIQEIEKLLNEVKERLVPLIEKIKECKQPDTSILHKRIDENESKAQEKELAFVKKLTATLGFDYENGRLDLSTHPFTCHPADVRITTRLSDGWFGTISSAAHEAGHGMYEQGLPKEHFATPAGMDAWLSIHESQSRFWEKCVAESYAFCEFLAPQLKEYDISITPDELYQKINKVEPGFIRVNADEVTYPLHIVLRFEIERDLMNGSLLVDNLPKVWNQKMQELLKITPPDDAQGVLQDVHWAAGLFGYFPTYVLGSMIAAQLFAACEKDLGSLDEKMRKGDFKPLLEWLRKNIHEHGRIFKTEELVEKATGSKVSAKTYLTYLESKYAQIYSLS